MIGGLILYVTVIGVCGFATAAALSGPDRKRLVEIIAMSATFGCGVVPIALSWLSMAGLKPSGLATAILAATGTAAIALLWKAGRLPGIATPLMPKLRHADWLGLPAAILLAAVIAASFATALVPVFEIDAMAIWGLKAKVLYYEPLNPRPMYFSDLSLSYSHLDYPLLVPMLWAGAYGAMGGVDDHLGRVVLMVPVVALAALLYARLREAINRSRSALLTALSVGLPVVLHSNTTGRADLTLAMFLLAAVTCLMRWLGSNQPHHAVAAAMLAAMAGFTKLEGLVVVASCLTVATLTLLPAIWRQDRRRIGGWAAFILALAITLGPWLIWSHDLPHSHEDYGSRLSWSRLSAGFDRIPAISRALLREIRSWSFAGTIGVLALAACLGWRGWRQNDVLAGWFVLAAQLLAYLAALLVTPWDPPVLVGFVSQRLLFHLSPLAMLLAAMHWRNLAENQS